MSKHKRSTTFENIDDQLTAMTLPQLRAHYEAVGSVIAAKEGEERASIEADIAARRAAFEAEIANQVREHGFDPVAFFRRGHGVRAAAAKYANPDNPSETWAGVGRKPNWLVEAVKAGAKLEDFAIKQAA